MDQTPKPMMLEGKIMGYEKKTLVIAAIIIIGAAAVFYAGAKYEKHKLSALGLLTSKSAAKKAAAGNSLKGIVTAIDAKSVTIKMTDGTTKNVPFTSSMTFGKNGTDSASVITVGEAVVIAGENNPDGTFAASNVRASKKNPKNPVAVPAAGTTIPATTETTPAPATTPTPAPATTVPMTTAPAPATNN